jgi:hypothetical protein
MSVVGSTQERISFATSARAAEQRYELATLQLRKWHPLPPSDMRVPPHVDWTYPANQLDVPHPRTGMFSEIPLSTSDWSASYMLARSLN